MPCRAISSSYTNRMHHTLNGRPCVMFLPTAAACFVCNHSSLITKMHCFRPTHALLKSFASTLRGAEVDLLAIDGFAPLSDSLGPVQDMLSRHF